MKLLLVPVLLVLLALAAIAVQRLRRDGRRGAIVLRSRPLMTEREQAMYWRLKETFPTSVVLAQVAFSALITSEFEHRNRFDRKVADFVLCDPSMKAQVVIELDDASHKGRRSRDAVREKLLTKAGYRVLRFANVPDQDDLRAYLQAQKVSEGRGLLQGTAEASSTEKAVRRAPAQARV